jgi:hypothetical protein
VIAATTGIVSRPERRRRPRTSVMFGYVQTMTSGSTSAISRRSPGALLRVSRAWVARRVGGHSANSQKPMSQIAWKR